MRSECQLNVHRSDELHQAAHLAGQRGYVGHDALVVHLSAQLMTAIYRQIPV